MLVNHHPVAAWISIPLSILWLVACSNALNLIDGLDGLATGVALCATLTTLLAAVLQGNTGLAMATIPLASCLLAFLRYNFNPASVFLGDCGSLTIGFLLGCFGLIWSQKSATFLGMAAPMMVLALPLLDVGLAIGRRYLSSRPIFQADRGHIHHRLLALGFKPRDVALILYAVCGIAACFSLLHSMVGDRFQGLTIILFCAMAVGGRQPAQVCGVQRPAGAAVASHHPALILQERTYLDALNRSIEEATTPDACWRVIYNTCTDLNFASVQMEFEGKSFADVLAATEEPPSWQMTLRLGRHGTLNLTRVAGSGSPALMLLALHTLQEQFATKQIERVPEPDHEPDHEPMLQ